MAVHCCFGFYEDKERMREQMNKDEIVIPIHFIEHSASTRVSVWGDQVHIRCFTIKRSHSRFFRWRAIAGENERNHNKELA